MEIFAISGSIRSDSFNTALLKAMPFLSPGNMNINLYTSIEETPIFKPGFEENNYPEFVKSLLDNIRKSEGLIISTPEYAHGMSGVLKNVLDWAVASDAIVLKPVVVTSVSTSSLGGVRSFGSLVQILTAMNSNIVIESSLCVPFAADKFNEKLQLIDSLTKDRIRVSLMALERIIEKNAT